MKVSWLLFITFYTMIQSCNRALVNKQENPSIHIPKIDTIPLLIEKEPAVIDSIDYYNPHFLRYNNFVYAKNIKTVTFHKKGLALSAPVYNLNRNEKIILTFDDLDNQLKNYAYTIVHCTSDWKLSDIEPYEYMEGFEEHMIQDYEFSFNTLQKYIHYTLSIPNESCIPKKPGNYLLKVYIDDNPEKLIITRRFLVVNPKATVNVKVKQPEINKYNQTHQQLSFTLDHTGVSISNPFEDIKVVILQNWRWDLAKSNIKPTFIKNNQLIYNNPQEMIFTAGKEFRWFDIRSFRHLTTQIEQFEVKFGENHVYIKPDEVRSYKKYFFNVDINGQFFIELMENKENITEADYAYVHFRLPFDSPLTLGNLYLFGAMTDWDLSEDFRMEYNYHQKCYEASVLLKQGYYNYEYIYIEDGDDSYDCSLIEGNYFEAENDYTILVYYHAFGNRYDELIGIETINTIKQ